MARLVTLRAARWLARAVWVVLPLALAGCAGSPQEFRLNLEGRDPATVSRAQEEAIREALASWFGTPDAPQVPPGIRLDRGQIQLAAGPVAGRRDGTQQGLFRQHCAACHGVTGDGAGPVARVLNPYPRDFRNGVFKFTSTAGGAKPVRDDLRHTVRLGVRSTAMPSFAALPDDQIEALVEYVRYLSLRGEAELFLLELVVDEDTPLPIDREEACEDAVVPTAELWELAEEMRVPVDPEAIPSTATARASHPERLAAIERGHIAYLDTNAQCVKCHGQEGRGDGEEVLYDDWNKRKIGVTPEQTRRLAGLFRLPVEVLKARDFREGIFHGGSAERDLYWRIAVGIKGTPMPAAGAAPGTPAVLTDSQIWDVIAYVRSLSQ